ncbi:hypothetical protein Scep_001667 [Stephania cephalantha]|uniref:Uncharacterized protein n=1 Tax=Stephania cephalantha TaxID=152367 RepID=A0AAP0L8N2_9MAGN
MSFAPVWNSFKSYFYRGFQGDLSPTLQNYPNYNEGTGNYPNYLYYLPMQG